MEVGCEYTTVKGVGCRNTIVKEEEGNQVSLLTKEMVVCIIKLTSKSIKNILEKKIKM